ncbi:MAG: DNA-binding protein [Butyrivibrio sp.]|nr:DNA-binding protein [Butyrivibrio sp.]
MKTKTEDKEILTVDESISHFRLSRRKFASLLQKDNNSFVVKYFNGRRLIIKNELEKYVNEHPEIRRRENAKRQ